MHSKHMLFFLLIMSVNGWLLPVSGLANHHPLTSTSNHPSANKSFKLLKRWRKRVNQGSKGYSLTPAIQGSVIYTAGHHGQVTATDLRTGKTLWQTATHLPISSGVTMGENVLGLVSIRGDVALLQASNGRLLWKKSLTAPILASPTITQHKLLAKTLNGDMFALNLVNGQQLWLVEQDESQMTLRASGAIALAGQTVLAGFAGGRFSAFHLQTGEEIWQQDLAEPLGNSEVEQLVDVDITPLVQGNTVFVAGYQGTIDAIDLATGQIFWQHSMSSHTGMQLSGSQLFIADDQNQLWAFDTATGGVNWRLQALSQRHITAPAVVLSSVMVADEHGYLHWLDKKTGAIQGQQKVASSAIHATPVSQADMLLVYSDDGYLTAYQIRPH